MGPKHLLRAVLAKKRLRDHSMIAINVGCLAARYVMEGKLTFPVKEVASDPSRLAKSLLAQDDDANLWSAAAVAVLTGASLRYKRPPTDPDATRRALETAILGRPLSRYMRYWFAVSTAGNMLGTLRLIAEYEGPARPELYLIAAAFAPTMVQVARSMGRDAPAFHSSSDPWLQVFQLAAMATLLKRKKKGAGDGAAQNNSPDDGAAQNNSAEDDDADKLGQETETMSLSDSSDSTYTGVDSDFDTDDNASDWSDDGDAEARPPMAFVYNVRKSKWLPTADWTSENSVVYYKNPIVGKIEDSSRIATVTETKGGRQVRVYKPLNVGGDYVNAQQCLSTTECRGQPKAIKLSNVWSQVSPTSPSLAIRLLNNPSRDIIADN